jgi:hypothetical protein
VTYRPEENGDHETPQEGGFARPLGSPLHNRASGSPDELLDVGVGDNHGLVVNLGGMLIEGVGGLGAEVAVPEVEVKCTDAVRATDAGELRTAFDPLGCVVSVSHNLIVSPRRRGNEHCGRMTKVIGADPSLPSRFSNRQMRYPDHHG